MLLIVILFGNATKHQKFLTVCYILETIDHNLFQRPRKSRARLKVMVIFTLTATVIATETILQYKFTSLQQMNLQEDEYFTLYYFFSLTMYFVIGTLLVHFTHITQNITARFKMVNGKIIHELKNLGKPVPRQNGLTNALDPCNGIITASNSQMGLINAYWLLCDATNEANMFYSDQLIAAILTLIIQTTTMLFYFFQRVVKCDILFIVNDGLWALIHFFHLVLLSHSSTDVTRSAEELAPMICKMMTLDLDPRLKRQRARLTCTEAYVGFCCTDCWHGDDISCSADTVPYSGPV
ncbi:hypothetical protein J6590_091644 [Homalodisca vitripennis]|nr:hypothetical protein J6590_091644 [Homalodisca vitripennis]